MLPVPRIAMRGFLVVVVMELVFFGVKSYFVLVRGPECHSTLLRAGEFRMTGLGGWTVFWFWGLYVGGRPTP